MRAAKVQASLRIRAVSPEPPLLAHTSIESRGTFRQKTRSLAPLNGWACAVKICHDGMLEDTKSLDAAHIQLNEQKWLFLMLKPFCHVYYNRTRTTYIFVPFIEFLSKDTNFLVIYQSWLMWKGYFSHRRTAKYQALFEHTIYGTRGSFRQRAGDLVPLDVCATALEVSLNAQP